jgi:hypothetical protein
VLLLGGLRGPLVMFLWSSSENQKNERDLEDFDTKVEMIRLLQPEFDSVHIYQAWNKGYNVSAQIASLPNKYAVILDAVRYLEKVDQSRPNNLNILLALNGCTSTSSGTAVQDSVYYRRQVRADTKWREAGSAAGRRRAAAAAGPDPGEGRDAAPARRARDRPAGRPASPRRARRVGAGPAEGGGRRAASRCRPTN